MTISSTQFKLLRKEKDPKFNIDHLEHYNLLLQVGFSDLETGISVVFMQDWEDNGVETKLRENVAVSRFVIAQLRAE